MALTIRLASALLASALAAGCNQSLFDASLGGGDPVSDGGNIDPDGGGGRDSGGERDGGDIERDSGPDRPDARVTDAGGVVMPDAGIPGVCPGPCAGDAYADFDGTSDGRNGLWRYVEVNSFFDSVEMTSATYPGAAGGWIGTGTPPPGIASCPESSEELPCGDQASTLVFITTPATAQTSPGLVWTAPLAGDYQLRVTWALPSTAPPITNLFYIIVGESNIQSEFSTDARPGTFDTMITLAEAETVTLTAFPNTNTSTSLAVNFYITGPVGLAGAPTVVEHDGSRPAGAQGVQP